MIVHADGTLPKNPRSIFVFGSNLAGVHGAGAALIAKQKFGAVQGKGIGHYGMSYAIPTKDRFIRTLKLHEIEPHIDYFCQYTRENQNLEFFITRVGCGLAGYKDSDIAPFFKTANRLSCDFPAEWLNIFEK